MGAPASRLLQDAQATAAPNATNATNKSEDWKKLPKEEDNMEVIINKKMFLKGGPFFNVSNLVTLFNDHGPEGVAEYPKAKKGTYHNNGTKINKTKEELEAEKKKAEEAKKANNGTEVAVVSEDDDQLEDTPAVQVMEVKFVNGDTMENI